MSSRPRFARHPVSLQANRQSAARSKEKKTKYVADLQARVHNLRVSRSSPHPSPTSHAPARP